MSCHKYSLSFPLVDETIYTICYIPSHTLECLEEPLVHVCVIYFLIHYSVLNEKRVEVGSPISSI